MSNDIFDDYLAGLEEPGQRERVGEIFAWIGREYPRLERRVAWNQPMFTDHGTFIVGFSTAKQHLSFAPEREAVEHFAADFERVGYSAGKAFVRIPWKAPVDYDLLAKVIDYNIAEKADCDTFWRR